MRESCLHCTTKHTSAALVNYEAEQMDKLERAMEHISAAMIQNGECQAGYKFQMRVIGHMHEAEDESRAWPRLSRAIRMARIAYQQNGTCPDFEGIGAMIAAANHGQLAGLGEQASPSAIDRIMRGQAAGGPTLGSALTTVGIAVALIWMISRANKKA